MNDCRHSELSAYEQVAASYSTFACRPFPAGYACVAIGEIDLIMLDHRTAGLISHFMGNDGSLRTDQLAMFDVLNEELKTVLQTIGDDAHDYFAQLHEMVKLILDDDARSKDAK